MYAVQYLKELMLSSDENLKQTKKKHKKNNPQAKSYDQSKRDCKNAFMRSLGS